MPTPSLKQDRKSRTPSQRPTKKPKGFLRFRFLKELLLLSAIFRFYIKHIHPSRLHSLKAQAQAVNSQETETVTSIQREPIIAQLHVRRILNWSPLI
jgi:hypothetical protein